MTTTPDSFIKTSDAATSYVGPDAIRLYQARNLAVMLRLYAKTGVIPTRGVTLTQMLRLAAQIQGRKPYGKARTRYDAATKAAKDLNVWADTMLSALPIVTTKREG
jgi:hypothetical protein